MKKLIQILLVVSSLLWLGNAFARTVDIKDLRLVKRNPSQWRLVMDLSGPVTYRKFMLHKPDRLVIDIPRARFKAKLNKRHLEGTPIKNIRSGFFEAKILRLVIELRSPMKPYLFTLPANGPYGNRLVVDLNIPTRSAVSQPKKSMPKLEPTPSKSFMSALKPILTAKPLKRKRDIVVVIDPGHGGKDPGATGVHRIHEKNVVLKISKDLRKLLNQQQGFHAVLTRNADYFISLRGRLDIARRDHADIFIAIHADAYRNSHAQGASVFALSPRGATSEAARWLAERENRSELMGGVQLTGKGQLLRSVLIDLSQTATIGSSLSVGKDILLSLQEVTRLHHNSVEQAAFVVLKSPDIPSLLIETGFLSNPSEAKHLSSSSYRQKLAYAIMRGVRDYYMQHPPRGTYWSKN